MKKTWSALFVALFFLLCLLPTTGMLLFGESEAGANELLASAPSLTTRSGAVNTDFFSDLSQYINDRFFLRQEAITAWNMLNVKLLASSPAEKVSLGRDGWLFYSETLYDTPLTERELWCAARSLCLLQEYARGQGCAFLFAAAPNKATVCPEKLRGTPPESQLSDFAALLSEMGVNTVDLLPALRQGGAEYFFATDSHWNSRGAAAAADALLAALGRTGDFLARGTEPGAAQRCDLAEMLYPAAALTEPDTQLAGGFTYRYASAYHSPSDLSILTEGEGTGSLLCFRDSFGNALHPYLAESFASATFSRKTAYDMALLTESGADTLLIELVERNLDYLYKYPALLTAPVRELTFSGAAELELDCPAKRKGEQLLGELPTVCDATSPIYLRQNGVVYEAMPTPAGYAACLPEGAGGEIELIYIMDGAPVIAGSLHL